MGPESGLDWQPVPSGMDDLFYPEMRHSAYGRGLSVLVGGTGHDHAKLENFTVFFDRVEAFWAVEDSYYGALGGEIRTGSVLNVTTQSNALTRIAPMWGRDDLRHFAIVGGWMQYEVLTASEPTIMRHEGEATALEAVREVLR